MNNLMETLNQNSSNNDYFQEIKPKAFEQIVEVYNNLCSFLNTCIKQADTDNMEKQLDLFIDKLRHNNYYSDYYEIDDNTYDVLYLNKDVENGELDECTLTVTDYDGKLAVSSFIEIGIKGEDYPISVTIEDVIYTLTTLDK